MRTVFNPGAAKTLLRARLSSLERDTKRCFAPIDNLAPAPFPAVLYAFATIDYLSSCWRGWNDSKRNPRRKQTERLESFLVRICRYGKKESRIAVMLWRHKLMHTGEPRLLRNKTGKEIYAWQIHGRGKSHMKLVKRGKSGRFTVFKFQLNPFVLARDLRQAVFGKGGYWDKLKASKNLQRKFLAFMRETSRYTITM